MEAQGKKLDDDQISLISQYSQAVVDIDKKDITELKSFLNPPQAVKDVLEGTAILLGHTGRELEWISIKKYLGKTGEESLQRRVYRLDLEGIPPETRKKANAFLSKYTTDEIKQISKAIAALHIWARAVADQ